MNVPAGTLVLGVPGKVVRPLTEEEKQANSENAAHYVKLAEMQMKRNYKE
jgi:carbonic anhydrase/acetyltransferase-like protein (isoleucine patch superfamily)